MVSWNPYGHNYLTVEPSCSRCQSTAHDITLNSSDFSKNIGIWVYGLVRDHYLNCIKAENQARIDRA